MAAKELFCDPCSQEDMFNIAFKYCSECEEHLCEECAGSHVPFKAFKSHHLIDLSSAGFRIPSSANICCEIHTDTQLDFYCSHHDAVCCKSCIPDSHSSCRQVYPLEVASKNVRNSTLLSDTFNDLRNISNTLENLISSREVNIASLAQSKSSIMKQIREVREEILKNLDDIEQNIVTDLSLVEDKIISMVKKEKAEISKLENLVKSNIEEIEILKEHASNNQLFLTLQKQIPHTQRAELKVQEIVSSVKEIDIKFERNTNLELKVIGSIEEITRPCDITYTTYKSQQAQVQPDTVKSLTDFKPDGEVQLKSGESYFIRGIAVTADNKLLLCNQSSSHPKVYIYKDGKTFENEITFSSDPNDVAVIPCSHTAVVTLPGEQSVQFINTANNTKERKINIRVDCWGVTATKDTIYLGGNGTVYVYGTDGSKVTTVTTGGGWIYSIHYNGNNDQILVRQYGTLRCIDRNRKFVYQYTITGSLGLAVDRHGDVYTSGFHTNDIHRLSSDGTFRDIVLKKSKGVKHPTYLSFNHDFTKLFFVNAWKSVSVYNCK